MQSYSSSEAAKQAVDCIDSRDCHLVEQAPTRCAVQADMPVRPNARGRIFKVSDNFDHGSTTNPPLEDFGAPIEHLIKPNLVSDFG